MGSKGYRLRWFENDADNALHHDLWFKLTRKLPRAQVRSLNSFRYKWPTGKFDPRSRIFAFDSEGNCIGCAGTAPGSEDFWTIDYPLLLKTHPDHIRSEMFEYLLGYATDHVEVPYLCQRFKEEWKSQIHFFKGYGFDEWFKVPIFSKKLEPFKDPVIKDKDFYQENGHAFSRMTDKDYLLLIDLSKRDVHGSIPYDEDTINYLQSEFSESQFSWKVKNSNKVVGFFAVQINWHQKNASINSILVGQEDLEWQLFNFIHTRLAEKGIYEVYLSIFPDSKRIPFLLDSGYRPTSAEVYLNASINNIKINR
ncbi:MAG: hypothetical protein ACFFD4_21455 [Candidatus Odinarchaeota archaeon]